MNTINKTRKILILSAYKPAGVLIDIYLGEFENEKFDIERTIAKCSDDIESGECFDLTFVNETDLFEQLFENKNLLIQNLGKIIVLSDYRSNINRLKGQHVNVKFLRKEDSSEFPNQIKRTARIGLGLVRPMARVMAD